MNRIKMTTFNSDQAEHIIITILEAIADKDDLRESILDELDMDDETFVKFVENVQVSCEDVRF